MFKAPDIEKAKQVEILKKIKEIAPFYLKEVDMVSPKGANAAMLQIVTNMIDIITRRLNQVPDKNLVAFLDMMSAKLLPPQPARAPITFVLSEGAKNNVTVPAQKQLAAGDIIFETDKTFIATPAKLLKAYSIDFTNDKVYEVPAGILNGNKTEPFNTKLLYDAENTNIIFVENAIGLQKGDVVKLYSTYYQIIEITDNKITLDKNFTSYDENDKVEKVTDFNFFKKNNLQQHILYFGDSHLFYIESVKSVITIPDKLEDFRWEYYGKDEKGILGWHEFEFVVQTLKAKQIGESQETSINGIKKRWVRCIIKNQENIKKLELYNTKFSVSVSPTPGIQPDLAFNNDIPLDLTLTATNPIQLVTAIYPLGKAPRLYDTFYISSQECFSKKGANVTITIQGTPGGGTPTTTPQLSWEYWDGNSWVNLKVEDNTSNFTIFPNTTDVVINGLPEIKPTQVNGTENLWIRAKLIAGHYGLEKFVCSTNNSPPTLENGAIIPPEITNITISYEYKKDGNDNLQFCEKYLVYSNLEYKDISEECKDEKKAVSPFEVFDGDGTQFYLGFDRKPEKGPVPVFFDLDTSKQGNEEYSIVRWEYCSGVTDGKEKWDRLEVLDNTKGFIQSDTVEFVFPDMCLTKRFGQELYWIRATGLDKTKIKTRIKSIHLNTAWASQMQTFNDVVLSSSDGSIGQIYFFPKKPVLSAEVWVNEINTLSIQQMDKLRKNHDIKFVEVKDKDGNITEFWLKWEGTDNLFTLKADSRGYEIDKAAGLIRFGDNTYGLVPPIGKNNIKVNYRIGGGIKGNVKVKEINTLKSSVAFVDKVFNPISAGGGSDVELLDSAIDRGAHAIKNRNRVITAEDYEYMVLEFSSAIARVKCLPDSKKDGDYIEYKPGSVVAVILPSTADERPVPSPQLIYQVKNYLNDFTPATANIDVREPRYWAANTNISIVVKAPEYIPSVEKNVSEQLKIFLHPLSGGYDGKGWEFGRIPYLSDIYALIEKIEGVDHINSLQITLETEDEELPKIIKENDEQVSLNAYDMVCNGTHLIQVGYKQEATI